MQIKKKYKRLISLISGIVMCGVGTYLILNTASKNIMFYLDPSEVLLHRKEYENQQIQIGGLVVPNSLYYNQLKQEYSFELSDCKKIIHIKYSGVLPSLFRNGQGIIAKGTYMKEILYADKLLTKHDESYIPQEIKDIKLSFCGKLIKYKSYND